MLESYPSTDQLDLPRLFRAELRVDRRLDPASVNRATVWIASGPVRVTSAVSFDPIDNVISLAPFLRIPLEPEVLYRLSAEGLRDLSGAVMSERYVAPFRTGTTLGELVDPPPVSWSEVAPLFAMRCGTSGCHGDSRPAAGLDLSSGAGVKSTAVGVSSRIPGAGSLSPLADYPIVDVTGGVGRPSHSYLMYKILGDPNIAGDPMPQEQLEDPSRALRPEEVRLVSDWIRSGAPTD